jgi:hypothetical protein
MAVTFAVTIQILDGKDRNRCTEPGVRSAFGLIGVLGQRSVRGPDGSLLDTSSFILSFD